MAARVVKKTVGKRTRSARQTEKRVKPTATRRPTIKATTMAKMRTVMVNRMKRKRGGPERAMFVRRKACRACQYVAHSTG